MQVTNSHEILFQAETVDIPQNINVFWITASYGYETFPIGMAFRNSYNPDFKDKTLRATVVNTEVTVKFNFNNNTVTANAGTGGVSNDVYFWVVPINI